MTTAAVGLACFGFGCIFGAGTLAFVHARAARRAAANSESWEGA